MKKWISLCLAFVLIFTLAACTTGAPSATDAPKATDAPEVTDAPEATNVPKATDAPEATAENMPEIRLGGLTGPTSIGMVKLIQDAKKGESDLKVNFTLAGSADELTPLLAKGELDIAAVPINLAAVLYQKMEGKVQLLALNTLGVNYIVENGAEITDLKSLKGKTILATGKGSVPEYALTYLLAQNGLDIAKDVTMDWKSEPAEVVAQMKINKGLVAMLPQPYVTVAQTQVEDLKVALDLTQEWDQLQNGSQLITAGFIVRTQFAKENPALVEKFLAAYADSAKFVNENVEQAAPMVEDLGIIKAAVAQKAIPYCKIVCITGDEMKNNAAGYLEILHTLNPASVGGKLPDENFYFIP